MTGPPTANCLNVRASAFSAALDLLNIVHVAIVDYHQW